MLSESVVFPDPNDVSELLSRFSAFSSNETDSSKSLQQILSKLLKLFQNTLLFIKKITFENPIVGEKFFLHFKGYILVSK